MSIIRKLAIGAAITTLAYKGVKWVSGALSLDKNFNYDITFNRIHRVYLQDFQLRVSIVLNVILYNGSSIGLKATNFSTSISSSEGYLLATTDPVDILLTPGQTHKTEVTVDANVIGFLTGLSTSYKLKGVNMLTVLGMPITTKPFIIDVGPYIKQATDGLAWVKTFLASHKKQTETGGVVSGLKEGDRTPSSMSVFSVSPKSQIMN